MTKIDWSGLAPEATACIHELEEKNHELEQKIVRQQVQIQNLYEMLVNARKHTFGQSSEQSKYLDGAEQLNFFNEAEKEFNKRNPRSKPSALPSTHVRKSAQKKN